MTRMVGQSRLDSSSRVKTRSKPDISDESSPWEQETEPQLMQKLQLFRGTSAPPELTKEKKHLAIEKAIHPKTHRQRGGARLVKDCI